MTNMFSSCEKLNNLNLSSWNTSNVTDMRWMLWGCKSLNDINLSNWDTTSVESMRGMFSFTNFSSLDLSSFTTTDGVLKNGKQVWDDYLMYFLQDCPTLTSLTLSTSKWKSTKNYEAMFRNDQINYNTGITWVD